MRPSPLVTTSRFKGERVVCHVVQIAGGSVSGIDSYARPGQSMDKGETLGMIRIGSQVDLVVTWKDSMKVRVKPCLKVRAGETILVD